MPESPPRARLIEGLPVNGPWTPLGLGRGQFMAILAAAIALFVWVDGAVWQHVHDAHLRRIAVSYAAIPVLAAGALWQNGCLTFRRLVGATIVLSVVKLLVTAMLLAVVAMAR